MNFEVTSKEVDEIVVEYPGHRHEEQEQNDTLPKQVPRSALGPLPQVAHKVLLPHKQVHQASKGGRCLAAEKPSAPKHGKKRRVCVPTILVGSVDTFKGRGAWPLDSFAIAVFTLMLQFASKKSVLDDADQGDNGEQDDAPQGLLVHFVSAQWDGQCSHSSSSALRAQKEEVRV